MISPETQEKIVLQARKVNEASEKYQLIHATFAIEKMFKDKMQQQYAKEYEKIRKELMQEPDGEKKDELFQTAKELQKESSKRIKIVVDYISQMKENSARTTRTPANTFIIALPKSMENVRKEDGTIDFDKLSNLRHLMAHELGHIVLHSGAMDFNEEKQDSTLEEEADFFAEKLIEMRRERNEQIYNNQNYKRI